ncbi:hypothetical protein CAEBREN_30266 [Caenorhabditis brenneri]|uniref:Uncharacterized protein n=1 Tax=Caenorhabditis brenneri TaxID=135651 RepID=G0MAQ1_CAEBE|nr:hypothetical protein CAEBREN_30266 [Caenorhabditis brenneri]
MVKKFLYNKMNQDSNVATISHQTASGRQGNVVTV